MRLLLLLVVLCAATVHAFMAKTPSKRLMAIQMSQQCPEVSQIPRPGREIAVPVFASLNGVERCLVGYAGGTGVDPTYESIQDYSEALLIEFDPTIISYESILACWREQHTPYPNKRQYRSCLLYLSEEQRLTAEAFNEGQKYVDIEPTTKFYLAEEYHQNYVAKLQSRMNI